MVEVLRQKSYSLTHTKKRSTSAREFRKSKQSVKRNILRTYKELLQ